MPGVFSQGRALDELERNLHDAYELMYPLDSPGEGIELSTKGARGQ